MKSLQVVEVPSVMNKLDDQEQARVAEQDQPIRPSSAAGNNGSTRRLGHKSGWLRLGCTRGMVQAAAMVDQQAP